MGARATPNGIYRTPGRDADVTPAPRPPWRLLLAPLWRAASIVLVVAVPLVLFNAIAKLVLDASSDLRLVPSIDIAEDALAVSLLASFLVLVHAIARRVRPQWGALGVAWRAAYVAALLLAQLVVVTAGETALFFSRGGLHLFEPILKRSSMAPDGRSAHVFGGGLLSCRYEVYVAAPFSPTMRRQLELPVERCDGPTPHVRWNADRSVQLVDASGAVIEPRPSRPFPLFWGGGC